MLCGEKSLVIITSGDSWKNSLLNVFFFFSPLHGTHSRSFSSFGFAIKIFQFFSATTKEVLRQKLISGYVEGGYVEGERIEGYVKDACVEGCVEGRCVIIEGCIEDGVFSTVLFSRSILLGLRRFAAGFGGAPVKGFKFL
ncbi:unnamed protein product [Rhizophagus irregularis]|uniref:Uncharacterized protein n=1 Tax=Rhizophagus irregularis TaxID=588596 RepID=A0A915ZXY7_9GLOM|nr:unnamed protein product [Rhizophagus irregularis]